MARFWAKAPSSRMGRSICTLIATAAVNASQTTTPIGSAINQIRVVSNLGIWITVGSSSVTATANSDTYLPASTVEYLTVSPGQAVAAISTSTSTGFFVVTEMH